MQLVVKDMGKNIPSGYAGRSTSTMGMDKDTVLCTHHQTHTPTCRTRTHNNNFSLK